MARDKTIEKFLNDQGVKWQYDARFTISRIDIDASRRNQVRTGDHVDEDQVIVYAAAMENGEMFPPIVLDGTRLPRGKAVVADGNHRLKAAKDLMDVATIESYVITEATELQLLLTMFKGNAKNGLSLSRQDRIRHALILVANGATQKKAAEAIGIPTLWVSTAARRQESVNRLMALGVRNITRLADNHLTRFSSIRSNELLKPLAEVIIRHRISTADADRFITRLNKERSQEAQLKLVDEWRKVFEADEIIRGGKETPIEKMPLVVGRIKRVASLVSSISVKELRTVPKEIRGELAERAKFAGEQMIELSSKLNGTKVRAARKPSLKSETPRKR
jgi:ParB-like chromosome segregation protein Spo0J